MNEKLKQISAAIGISVVSVVGTTLFIDNEPVADIQVQQEDPFEVSATCNTEEPNLVNGKFQYKFNCTTSDNKDFKSAVYFVEKPSLDQLQEAQVKQMNDWVNVVKDQSTKQEITETINEEIP